MVNLAGAILNTQIWSTGLVRPYKLWSLPYLGLAWFSLGCGWWSPPAFLLIQLPRYSHCNHVRLLPSELNSGLVLRYENKDCMWTFSIPSALYYHERNCQPGKRQITQVLDATKVMWKSHKRQRLNTDCPMSVEANSVVVTVSNSTPRRSLAQINDYIRHMSHLLLKNHQIDIFLTRSLHQCH